jgi:hypothetical protein
MKLIAKNTIMGLKKDPQEPTLAGESFDISDPVAALELIASDAAAEDLEDEDITPTEDELLNQQKAADKAAVLAHIGSAATIETLEMVKDKLPAEDVELIDAYEAKFSELNKA